MLSFYRISDILSERVKIHFEPDEARKKESETKLHTETLPNNLKIFDKHLTENNGHLGGSSLNYADVSWNMFINSCYRFILNRFLQTLRFQLYLYSFLEWLGDKRDAVLQSFPAVQALMNEIKNHPKIAAYLEKRPVTAM